LTGKYFSGAGANSLWQAATASAKNSRSRKPLGSLSVFIENRFARCQLVSKDFLRRLEGYGLTTAEIHYHIPGHTDLLQLFVWQEYDLAPRFPALRAFLEFWQQELEGALHSVRIAHNQLVQPSEWKAVDGVFRLN